MRVTATNNAVSPAIHAAFAAWVAAMLLLATTAPNFYDNILQEDRFVEWLTAIVFLVAGVLYLGAAVRSRRIFDALVGLFCIFVGGEEFSWGQRLLGFTPPDVFLERNTQQEFTLHNFADVFGQPKGVLILALVGYGVVLPAAQQLGLGRVLKRVGATSPHMRLMPWFAVAIVLLIWYPAEFTGEWVEALAATLFLVASPGARRLTWFAFGVVLAVILTLISARGLGRSTAARSCALSETQALLQDIATLLDADADLFHTRVHKRLYATIQSGYIPSVLINYETAQCDGGSTRGAAARRRYGLDPWGMAYWVRSEPDAQGRTVITVYSFGANRKRDGDDIASSARIE